MYYAIIEILMNTKKIMILIEANWTSSRVFANGPGDWGSISGRVIPKTQKWYLIPPWLTLNIIR